MRHFLQLEGQEISQNYDVWSLGCVFLEFLSWFLLGYDEAIDRFAQERADDSLQGNVKEDTFFTFEKGKKNPDGTSNEATLKKSVVEVRLTVHTVRYILMMLLVDRETAQEFSVL